MTRTIKTTANPEYDAAQWNAAHPVGARVVYLKDDGSEVETATRAEASVLGGHTAVAWLTGVRSCVDLRRVRPA